MDKLPHSHCFFWKQKGDSTHEAACLKSIFTAVWKRCRYDVATCTITNYYCYYYKCFTALCPGIPGWASTRRKIHSLTYPDHHPSFISFFHLLRFMAFSLFNLRAWQSFCTTSVQVYFLVWSPPPDTPYIWNISLPNQCLLFATHVHTIATCFAVALHIAEV